MRHFRRSTIGLVREPPDRLPVESHLVCQRRPGDFERQKAAIEAAKKKAAEKQ